MEKINEKSVKALWSLFIAIGDRLLKTSDQKIEIDFWLNRIEESIEINKKSLTENSLKMLKQITQFSKNENSSKYKHKSADFFEQKFTEVLNKYMGVNEFDIVDEIIVKF